MASLVKYRQEVCSGVNLCVQTQGCVLQCSFVETQNIILEVSEDKTLLFDFAMSHLCRDGFPIASSMNLGN
jgi:hypothetical protein